MNPIDWTALLGRRRDKLAESCAIVDRLYLLLEALNAVEQAEHDVDLPTDHPRWQGYCDALDGMDFLYAFKRLKAFADAWRTELDEAAQ